MLETLLPLNGIEFLDWGLIDYEQSLKNQEELVEKIHQEKLPGFIVFCTHPPIVTLGRKTEAGDVFAWEGPTKEVSRGGRATYHGPSQLVIYPLLNLDLESNPETHHWPKHDVGYVMRGLETAIINTLKVWNIQATGKSLQKNEQTNSSSEETGVWVENKKVASVGIGVRHWVSMHGAAINMDYDRDAFFGMNPCGFKKEIMTSIEELLGKKIDHDEFNKILMMELLKVF